jgi:hypothetical protein
MSQCLKFFRVGFYIFLVFPCRRNQSCYFDKSLWHKTCKQKYIHRLGNGVFRTRFMTNAYSVLAKSPWALYQVRYTKENAQVHICDRRTKMGKCVLKLLVTFVFSWWIWVGLCDRSYVISTRSAGTKLAPKCKENVIIRIQLWNKV